MTGEKKSLLKVGGGTEMMFSRDLKREVLCSSGTLFKRWWQVRAHNLQTTHHSPIITWQEVPSSCKTTEFMSKVPNRHNVSHLPISPFAETDLSQEAIWCHRFRITITRNKRQLWTSRAFEDIAIQAAGYRSSIQMVNAISQRLDFIETTLERRWSEPSPIERIVGMDLSCRWSITDSCKAHLQSEACSVIDPFKYITITQTMKIRKGHLISYPEYRSFYFTKVQRYLKHLNLRI